MQQISFWQTWIVVALLMAIPITLTAQETELTLDDLFATPKLTGTTPSRPVWAPNSEQFAFSWSEPGNPGRGLWVSTSDGKELRLISNSTSASVRDIIWTDANTILSLRADNLWQTTLSRGVDLQLMPVKAGASNLSISPNGNQAAYLRNGDLWLADFASKQNRQLTEIGIAPLSSLPKGRYSRAEREIGPGIWSGPTYKWSPDGKTIAIHVVDRREMRKVPFPDYLAEETDPNEVRRSYPGDPNEIRKVGLLDVESGNITYLDLPNPNANQVIDFNWSQDGALLVDIASDTAVERKLFVLAAGESQLREIWRGVRESRMYTSFGSTWHPDGKNVVFLSDMGDRYGLYRIDASPSRDRPQLLTDPSYDVLSAPSIAGDALFYAGNGVNPYEQHVYRLKMSGGAPEQVTQLAGQNVGYPSPDGRHLVFTHSNDTAPPELYVMSSDGGEATRVTQSPLSAFTERTWAAAEYVTFPSLVDDYTLHARILKPTNMQPGKKYPVLFGPVYSNTARNRWAGNYSLIQHLLSKKGYIIVQVDSRGSNGYGRAFREEFLLGFADQDIEDYASAVAYMESLDYVDPDRIGIWGSSYGGTLSVYSLLMKPGLFQVGVAAAAAVDPMYFGTDDVAIVRTPQTHPEIFERKALKYAGNLEDKLLFIHGMQDHVVPFKTTAVLAEELIKKGKDFDFTFAPGATHGWSREGYYDRYLFGKMIEYFDRHLGVPSK
ncbi:prolyl oligopeptidase family serine peptidase [Algoriphagus sediminis]|uniref:Prolyl oligopeptidase family serine peptidase n=1 Tax=Algoriphagus sediminis TaxID=3057113 RepID=A0ABT7YC02_9BACT|nr:prolyl oligopeptidase family serine peptidase [Algoriphagus sediminis]MDN3203925.1 prolyl oligopeptidase family serine peptidase [Algoriphagus sediminis]